MDHKQGDFAQLFREHYPRIFRYVRYRVGDDMMAEDLTSEIFERAYRYLGSYDPARSSFGTWLTHIASNWVNNHFDRQRRHERNETDLDEGIEVLSAPELTPEAQAISGETLKVLLECVSQLPARQRQIVALRFGSEMRNKDIASITGIKEHSVSVILLRALEQLRRCQEGT